MNGFFEDSRVNKRAFVVDMESNPFLKEIAENIALKFKIFIGMIHFFKMTVDHCVIIVPLLKDIVLTPL